MKKYIFSVPTPVYLFIHTRHSTATAASSSVRLLVEDMFAAGFAVSSVSQVCRRLHGIYPTDMATPAIHARGTATDGLTDCEPRCSPPVLLDAWRDADSLVVDAATQRYLAHLVPDKERPLPPHRVVLSTLWTLRAILGNVVLEDMIVADRVAALRRTSATVPLPARRWPPKIAPASSRRGQSRYSTPQLARGGLL